MIRSREEDAVPNIRPAPALLSDALLAMPAPTATSLALLVAKADYTSTMDFSNGAPFALFADLLADVSATSSRLGSIVTLSRLFYAVAAHAEADLLPTINLTLNRVAPAHEGLELGVGDATVMKVISESCGITPKALRDEYQKCGDLAEVAQTKRKTLSLLVTPKPLTIKSVFSTFKTIAVSTGKDVQRRRMDLMIGLIRAAKGPEVNFIVRALQGKMRIGVAETSALSALGVALAVRHISPANLATTGASDLQRLLTFAMEGVTRIYHEVPSFDLILPVLLQKGVAACMPEAETRLGIQPGIPVKPMLAHATNGITSILDRFQGKNFTCEYKYDGERAQIHYTGGKFSIYSRNSECHTDKYPDVIASLPTSFNAENVTSFILDCEVVAVDEHGKLLAFQVLQHRGRKGIKVEDVTIKVALFAFDILYFNGRSLLRETLRTRRDVLRSNFIVGLGFRFAQSIDADDTELIQGFFDKSVVDGCEGLMVKTLDVDANYTPFRRSFHWLKLKKDYIEGVGDTLDLVPIGAYFGKGKRTGVFGGYLLACYDPETEEYQSVCKIGTGFTDDVLQSLTTAFENHQVRDPPPYYRTHDAHKPDVWLREALVWEIRAADLTISPTHHAGFGLVEAGKGIALRFPRFLRVRDDKGPTDATTSSQIADLYRQQALAQQQLPQDAKGDGDADGYD